MKTENLIEKLSRDLQPVKPLPSTWWRASWLFLVMIGGSLAVFTLFSIRHDIHEALSRDQFWLGAGGLLLAWMFLGYSLALSQLPTFESKKYFSVGIIFIDLLAFVYLIKAILAPGGYLLEGFSLSGVKCSLDILLLCLIPFILMIWILKKIRAATTRFFRI